MARFGAGGFGSGVVDSGIVAALEAADPTTEILAGAAGWRPVGASWLDGRLLAESVPIIDGKLSAVASQQVPERVTFTVPEWADGFSWIPGDNPDHPLARFGQEIDLAIDVTAPVTGSVTTSRLGRFRVQDWQYDDAAGTVEVTALGRLQRPAESKFITPEVPRADGTLATEFRRLMVAGVPVWFDPALEDRPCPQSFQWPEDRLDALYEIATAWPARIRVDRWGTVQVLAPLPAVPDPQWFLTDGEAGTVVSAPRSDTRDGSYNVVVGTSSATDSAGMDPVRAVAVQRTGPMAATDDGTGYGRVVRRYSSPLVTNAEQMQAAVDTLLADSIRPSVVQTVRCAPDPRIWLDDAVSVTRGGVTSWGWVVAIELPLTVDGGLMRIDVGVSA